MPIGEDSLLSRSVGLVWSDITLCGRVHQNEHPRAPSHANCPRFDELQREVAEGEAMRALYRENRDLFEYVSVNSGLNITDIVSLDYVYDTLLVGGAPGQLLPAPASSCQLLPASGLL